MRGDGDGQDAPDVDTSKRQPAVHRQARPGVGGVAPGDEHGEYAGQHWEHDGVHQRHDPMDEL